MAQPDTSGDRPNRAILKLVWGAILPLMGAGLLGIGLWELHKAAFAPDEIPVPTSLVLRQSEEAFRLSSRSLALTLAFRPEELEALLGEKGWQKLDEIRKVQEKRAAEREQLERDREEMRKRHDAEIEEARGTERKRTAAQGCVFLLGAVYALGMGYGNLRRRLAKN